MYLNRQRMCFISCGTSAVLSLTNRGHFIFTVWDTTAKCLIQKRNCEWLCIYTCKRVLHSIGSDNEKRTKIHAICLEQMMQFLKKQHCFVLLRPWSTERRRGTTFSSNLSLHYFQWPFKNNIIAKHFPLLCSLDLQHRLKENVKCCKFSSWYRRKIKRFHTNVYALLCTSKKTHWTAL